MAGHGEFIIMPELPEVETIIRELEPKLVGLKMTNIWSDREKPLRQAGGLTGLKKSIKNRKIVKIWRRAKYIVIDLEGPKSLFVHQKMSGHLLYGKWKFKNNTWQSALKGPLKEDPENKYIRIIFNLNNGYQLAFSDLRRFGKVVLVNDNDVSKLKEIRDLGPEPLTLSYQEFKELFKSKKGRIKQVLMDPYFIVGIGNIYSDEILWLSGLHPLSRVENLSDRDLKNMFKATLIILKKAIKMKGSSNDDYRRPSGEKGSYQNIQKAYHRTGNKCAKGDGGVIERLKVGGRSAHFCPKHQLLK